MNKRVVIPKFVETGKKHFSPHIASIKKGDSIEWLNFDTSSHSFVFKVIKPEIDIIIPDLGPIEPSSKMGMNFNCDAMRIDYTCQLHPYEYGTIVILPRPLNNTEYLRYLQELFDTPTPDILHHLRFSNLANRCQG